MACDLGKSPSQPPDVASDDDAMLGEDATYLIHELRPASHQALAYPMEGLDRQLFGGTSAEQSASWVGRRLRR